MSEGQANDWQMVVVLIVMGYVGFYLLAKRWGPGLRRYFGVLHFRARTRPFAISRRGDEPAPGFSPGAGSGHPSKWSDIKTPGEGSSRALTTRNGKVLH